MSAVDVFLAILCLLIPRYIALLFVVGLFPVTFGGWLPNALHAGEFDFNFLDFIIIGLFIKQLIRLLMGKTKSLSSNILIPCVFFLLSYYISVLYQFSNGSEFAYLELVSLARFTLLFFVVFSVLTIEISIDQLRALKHLVLMSGVVYALSIYIQYILNAVGISVGYFLVYTDQTGRYAGIIGDPNQASIFLSFYAIYFMLMYMKINRFWYLAIFLGTLGSIFLTGTRGGILMLALGIISVFFAEQYKFRILKLALYAIPVAISLVILIPSMTVVINRSQGDNMTTGVAGRAQPFIRTARIVIDNPLVGVGYSGHRFVAHKYGGNDASGNMNGTYNQYSETLVNGGAISFVCYIYLIFAVFRKSRQTINVLAELPNEQIFSKAIFYYLVCVFVFLQTDVWLLPASSVGYLVFILIGINELMYSKYTNSQQAVGMRINAW